MIIFLLILSWILLSYLVFHCVILHLSALFSANYANNVLKTTWKSWSVPEPPGSSGKHVGASVWVKLQSRQKWSVISEGEELGKQAEGQNTEQPDRYITENL